MKLLLASSVFVLFTMVGCRIAPSREPLPGDPGGPNIACEAYPPPGFIRVLYRKYSDKDKGGRCGFFPANPQQATDMLIGLDTFMTHVPEVVYKSTGSYPLYTQRVVKGGCPPYRSLFWCRDYFH